MRSKVFFTALGLLVIILGVISWSLSVEAASIKPGKPIVLGLPCSFKATPWPLGAKYGWELAVEEINAAGGVKVGGEMHQLKLIVLDTRDEEPGVPVSESLLGIEKLILDEKVDVLVGGPTMSEASMAAIDLVAKYDIVHLITSGTWTPGWPKKVGGNIKKYRNSFKMSLNAVTAVQSGMELLGKIREKLALSKAFCIIDDVLFCRNAMDAFAGMAEKKGFTILGREAVPHGSTDFSPALMKAKRSGADLLFFWTNLATTTVFFKQFIDLEVPALPIGFAAGAQEHEVYKVVGGKVEYITFPNPHANITSLKAPGALQFQQAFENKFGRKPFGGSGNAYVGAYLLKDVIERTGSLETSALVAALEKCDYASMNGRIRFDGNHESIYSLYDPKEGVVPVWSQWQGGRRVAIWPPALADAEIKLPPWMKR